jgi:hypothetical protein
MAVAKFTLLRELFEMARAQRAHLEADRLDLVLDLMDQRDELVQQLEDLFAQGDVPANVIAFPSQAASDWSQQDQLALDTLIRGILEHDQQNERLLTERLAEIREELPRLERGRRANNGYRVPVASGARFIDRVS